MEVRRSDSSHHSRFFRFSGLAAHGLECRAKPFVVHVISTLADSVRRGQTSKNQSHKCDAVT